MSYWATGSWKWRTSPYGGGGGGSAGLLPPGGPGNGGLLPAEGLGNTNIDDARKALDGLNLGGGRNGGRRGIPENVDIDQIRELFNRR